VNGPQHAGVTLPCNIKSKCLSLHEAVLLWNHALRRGFKACTQAWLLLIVLYFNLVSSS